MLSRYSHIRRESKRNALAAVERKRVAEKERREETAQCLNADAQSPEAVVGL